MEVTVLIRCFNQEQYLYDCVRRLGNKKYVIISDYPQLGKRHRLNQAIKNVDTEWIAFNDADDMSLPVRFSGFSWELNWDNIDLIYTDFYTLSKRGCKLTRARPFNRELLRKVNYIPFSTIIVRTEIAKQCSFDKDVDGNGEDWIWLNDVANITHCILHHPTPTMIYRNFKPPYGRIPIYRKIKRILWQKRVRSVINARAN